MAQYLTLPNGSQFEIRQGETREQALSKALQQYPEAFGFGQAAPTEAPESGFVPALKSGIASLKSDVAALAGRTGIMDQAAAEKYIQEQADYQKRTFKPTETFGEAPLTKTLELFGGSVPYMAAPIAAGALAPAGALALGAAGAASAAQFTGSNLSRQMGGGKALGETDITAAALAAVPQAALDALSLKMLPGIRSIFGQAGKEVSKDVAQAIAQQSVKEVAKDYALATGKAMGTEGLTEVGQQALERLQASLSLTDEKARDEYLESLIGGAVLGGVLSPAGRYVERGRQAKKEEADTLAAAMKQREADAKQREEALTSPEGRLAFVEDYEARQARFQELKDMAKPGKDATPLQQAEYTEIKKEKNDLGRSLYRDSAEYKQAVPIAQQLREQRRVDAMTPQEWQMEQLGLAPGLAAPPAAPTPPSATDELFNMYTQGAPATTAPKAQEAPLSPAEQYAAQTAALVQKDIYTKPEVSDYVEYLMQNPEMAAQVAQARVKVPGLTTAENNALLSGINLQLKDIEKRRAAGVRDEMVQRTADIKAQAPKVETPDTTAQDLGEFYQQKVEEGQGHIEPTFEYLDSIFEQAFNQPPTIKISDKVQPIKNAPAMRERIESLMQQADQADKDYRTARAARQPDAALAAKNRGVAAVQEIDSLSQEGNEYSKEFLAARRQQNEALAGLQDVAEQLRTGQTLGGPNKAMAASTEETLTTQAGRLRAQLITNALQEAALHRRAAGEAQITQDEALKAASKLYDTVDTLLARAKTAPEQAEYEEVIVQPAQMRGTQIVKPAVTERREVKPAVQAISPAELQHFTQRIDAVRRQLFAPSAVQATRVEPELKTQFAETEAKKVAEARGETADTVGGQLRRRTEFVRDKMAKMGVMRPMARDVLNKAVDAMDAGRASQVLLDAVEPVVDAITGKRQITQTDLRAISDALKAAEPTAAEQQAQGQQSLNLLFEEPGQRPRLVQKDIGFIRSSFKNFENSPTVKKAKQAIAQATQLAKQLEAKRVQEEKDRAETAKKVAKAQQRRILDLEGTVRQQRNDLQQAVYDAIEAEKAALADAQKLAAAPQLKAAEQALAEAEEALKKFETRLETLTENIEFPWMERVKKEKASVRGRIGYQQTVVQNAKNELAQAVANSQVQYDNAAVVARANQDSLVQFERKALEKFEQRLEKLREQATAPSAELVAAQNVADEQRALVAASEKKARDAAEKADKAKRDLEQRWLSGLGLPGVKRAAGETVEIETAERKQLRKELDEAKTRFNEAQDALEGVKVEAPQVPKATGPVVRGVRTKVRKLTQERTPKSPEVETAVAEANVAAAERAAQEPEKTPVETAKEAALRQQQMREGKERLENSIRTQLADINIRIDALKKAIKPNPDLIKDLEQQRQSLQRDLVAARKDVEKEGALEKATQRELKKEERAQAKREAENPSLLSRGTPAKGQTVAELEASLDRALGEKGLAAGRISLFKSVADFFADPKHGRDYANADIPADAKAFVNPKNGAVFMFADNIAKNESVGVLLHEVGVHLGFRKLFSAAKFNALVQTAKNWTKRTDNSIEARIGRRAMARVQAAETSAEQADEELLAYTVEEALAAGVEPSALKNGSPVQNWLQLVLDTLRKALSAFGINPAKLTAGDLVNMAYGAAQLEIRGTWHGSDAKFTAFDARKAGAGEGAFDRRFDETNSIGAGPYTTPQQEYAEYYQYAVPFGKAANNTGYGATSYQEFRDMDEQFIETKNADLSQNELSRKFESRLLTAYLTGVSAGEDLDPVKNKSAKQLLDRLTKNVRNPQEKAAVAALDLKKIKGFSERPPMGYLYRALDDMPRAEIFSINNTHTLGERPKVDALLRTYADPFDVQEAQNEGRYPGNMLFYKMQRELGTKQTVALFKKAGINALERQVENGTATERAYIEQAPELLPLPEAPVGLSKTKGREGTGTLLFSRAAKYASPEWASAGEDIGKVVAQQRTWGDKIKANATGLAFETQLVDRFAAFERLRKYMPEQMGTQMMYYLRMYDQRMNFVSQAVSNGALRLAEKTRPDGKTEYLIESKEGANIANVVEVLRGAQPFIGNAEAVNQAFTTYLAALRADRVGLAKLNFGGSVTQEMLDRTMQMVNGNDKLKDVFEKARREYNAYNRDQIAMVAATGAISKETEAALTRSEDYIPFYRAQNGVVELLIGGEAPMRIGSIAEQPYLQELVGGDQPILDFMTSSVQNTNMLVDMALRNLATKNAVFELVNLGAAKIVAGKPAGRDVVQFKVDGQDRYAVISSEKVTIGGKTFETGVPADILVKGMEGIPTQMPFLFRAMAMPAQLLRKAVTLSPLYMAKQLFRDSLAAPITSGANFTPIMGALRQIGKESGKALETRGVTGGQYMTGSADDITKILRDISDGKPGWMSALSKAEAVGMKADALTRRAQYNSYIEQGMSEMEATLMALESMNFNKRGASPSIHVANALIPFFNAQIQGLNVLYKAMFGKMPFNDKLKIQQKLLMRGGMMAAASLLYAALMDDDEAYKNATPDQKYGNWFVRVPGVDQPIRVPVPFEIGYIFKALPEALYNSMTDKHGNEDAVKAFKQILLQSVPGGSSYGIPQIMKPAIEAGLGKSFYTGRDILSAREKELLPEDQFRANTAEISKVVGKAMGISPIVMENLVRGYTGTMGLAFLHALSLGAPKSESPEAAVKRLSDYPIVGGSFQPNDAGGITNAVYERFNEDIKVRNSYKKMVEEGRSAEAKELLQRRGNEIMEAEIADVFKQNMNKLTQAERAIAASSLPPEQKRKQLDELRKLKTAISQTMRETADKTVKLSSPL